MTGRTLSEWIGATPDTPIPPRVRLRVFEAHGGVCHISGRKIRAGEKWEADHVIALINGGENRESNLAPALSDKHKAKTAADVRQKADVARKRQKHLGIKTDSGRKLQSRGFDKTRRKKLNGTVEVRS
jgi:5-methylcytosine-specific restriction endonuclease McrA